METSVGSVQKETYSRLFCPPWICFQNTLTHIYMHWTTFSAYPRALYKYVTSNREGSCV